MLQNFNCWHTILTTYCFCIYWISNSFHYFLGSCGRSWTSDTKPTFSISLWSMISLILVHQIMRYLTVWSLTLHFFKDSFFKYTSIQISKSSRKIKSIHYFFSWAFSLRIFLATFLKEFSNSEVSGYPSSKYFFRILIAFWNADLHAGRLAKNSCCVPRL